MIEHGQRDIQRAATIDQLAQVLALDVFLGDIVDAVFAADLVDLHDIGMHQRCGRLGFVMETADIGFIVRQLALEHLDGHRRRSEACSAR